MYIKNQLFKDDDTLFEVLFDFEIGEPSPYMAEMVNRIKAAVMSDAELTAKTKNMEEEERMELYDDIQRENIVMLLKKNFDSFKVHDASMFGISGNKEVLLYTLDMY